MQDTIEFITNDKEDPESQHDVNKRLFLDSKLTSCRPKETTYRHLERQETALEQHTAVSSSECGQNIDTANLIKPHEHSSDNTPKQGIPESEDAEGSEHESRLSASNTTESKETAQADQRCNSGGKESKHHVKAPCDKILRQICNMTRQTRKLASQPERNNDFKKIVFDATCSTMIAETEDLMIEFCMKKEAVSNMCPKKGGPGSQYWMMREEHLREWPDGRRKIRKEGHSEAIPEFQRQLKQLKSFITRCSK